MKQLMKYHVELETTSGHKVKTWGIAPIGSNTKIVDGIYNPETEKLTILFDSITQRYKEFPVKLQNGKYEMQHRKMDDYYRVELLKEDIKFFLDNYVENNFDIEPSITPSIITNEQS